MHNIKTIVYHTLKILFYPLWKIVYNSLSIPAEEEEKKIIETDENDIINIQKKLAQEKINKKIFNILYKYSERTFYSTVNNNKFMGNSVFFLSYCKYSDSIVIQEEEDRYWGFIKKCCYIDDRGDDAFSDCTEAIGYFNFINDIIKILPLFDFFSWANFLKSAMKFSIKSNKIVLKVNEADFKKLTEEKSK